MKDWKENEFNYLNQKEINSRFSLNLGILPEIKSDYIFFQTINFSRVKFLKEEIIKEIIKEYE